MARPLLAALALCALLVPAGSAAAIDPFGRVSEGPYSGVVVQGETDLHLYATGPRWCIVQPRYYVTLTYEPAGDTLVLQAAGRSAVSSEGFAQVSFNGDCTAQFYITVSGASVETLASYTVKVTTGAATEDL